MAKEFRHVTGEDKAAARKTYNRIRVSRPHRCVMRCMRVLLLANPFHFTPNGSEHVLTMPCGEGADSGITARRFGKHIKAPNPNYCTLINSSIVVIYCVHKLHSPHSSAFFSQPISVMAERSFVDRIRLLNLPDREDIIVRASATTMEDLSKAGVTYYRSLDDFMADTSSPDTLQLCENIRRELSQHNRFFHLEDALDPQDTSGAKQNFKKIQVKITDMDAYTRKTGRGDTLAGLTDAFNALAVDYVHMNLQNHQLAKTYDLIRIKPQENAPRTRTQAAGIAEVVDDMHAAFPINLKRIALLQSTTQFLRDTTVHYEPWWMLLTLTTDPKKSLSEMAVQQVVGGKLRSVFIIPKCNVKSDVPLANPPLLQLAPSKEPKPDFATIFHVWNAFKTLAPVFAVGEAKQRSTGINKETKGDKPPSAEVGHDTKDVDKEIATTDDAGDNTSDDNDVQGVDVIDADEEDEEDEKNKNKNKKKSTKTKEINKTKKTNSADFKAQILASLYPTLVMFSLFHTWEWKDSFPRKPEQLPKEYILYGTYFDEENIIIFAHFPMYDKNSGSWSYAQVRMAEFEIPRIAENDDHQDESNAPLRWMLTVALITVRAHTAVVAQGFRSGNDFNLWMKLGKLALNKVYDTTKEPPPSRGVTPIPSPIGSRSSSPAPGPARG